MNHSPDAPHFVAAFVAVCVAALVAGCSTTAAPNGAGVASLPADARSADVVLIGEVHDNAVQHRLRVAWLEELARKRRIAIALEQLDAERQPDLDRALAADASHAAAGEDLASRARRVAEAAGFDFRGWDWDLYRPVVEFALRGQLPLVAANLSARQTARIARGDAQAAPAPAGWSAEDAQAMRESIRLGHCGLLPEKSLDPMASAQRSRDARIAQAIADARRTSRLPVVLLAGNGHLREDIGVPRHLVPLRPSDRIVSIALLEAGDPARAGFDHAVYTPAQPREDPCESLRARLRPSAS